jgi:hypothetical protein
VQRQCHCIVGNDKIFSLLVAPDYSFKLLAKNTPDPLEACGILHRQKTLIGSFANFKDVWLCGLADAHGSRELTNLQVVRGGASRPMRRLPGMAI